MFKCLSGVPLVVTTEHAEESQNTKIWFLLDEIHVEEAVLEQIQCNAATKDYPVQRTTLEFSKVENEIY